jgi:hypothetical protein
MIFRRWALWNRNHDRSPGPEAAEDGAWTITFVKERPFPAVPYHVTCRNCELLLYSAAPITERVCPRCGAELPEPQQGAPPNEPPRDPDDGESGVSGRRQARAQ